MERYDPALDVWQPVAAALPLPRSNLACASHPNGAIYAVGSQHSEVFGDEINVAKFGGAKHLTELAKVLKPLRKGQVTQATVFYNEQVTLEGKTTGEKKSGFVVKDGPWPGDAEPDPKWIFVVPEEPVEEEESEEEEES